MPVPKSRLLLLPLAALLVACDGSSADTSGHPSVQASMIPRLPLSLSIRDRSDVGPTSRRIDSLEVHVRWTTAGSSEEVIFGSIDGMVDAPDGSVWVSDGMSSRILARDDGGAWRVVADRGKGPGEVMAPGFLARTESGGVAVYGLTTATVHRFDDGGRFERSVRLARLVENPKSFLVTGSGAYVLSGGLVADSNAVHRFAADGRLDGGWEALPRTENERAQLLVAGGSLAQRSDGTLVYSQAAPFRVTELRPSGSSRPLLAEDRSKVPPAADTFVQEEGGWREFDWDFPRSRFVHALPDGRILNIIWDREKTRWEVYRGDELVRVGESEAYEPWAFVGDNRVLASLRLPATDEVVAVELEIDGL